MLKQFNNKKILLKMMINDFFMGKWLKFKIYYKTLILNKISSVHRGSECIEDIKSNENFEQLKKIFFENDGRFYINSVEFGGAFSYLKNQAKNFPVLIFNPISTSARQYNVEFIFAEISYKFNTAGLMQLVKEFHVSRITVNHLIWSRDLSVIDEIVQLAKMNIEVLVMVHDYFYMCPSFNLINYNSEFCNLPESGACNSCLKKLSMKSTSSELTIYRDTIRLYQNNEQLSSESWRSSFILLFNSATNIIFPSNAPRELFLKIFPRFDEKSIVINHDLQYLNQIKPVMLVNDSMPMRVAIMGDIKYHKGLKLFELLVLASIRDKLNISFLVIGNCNSKVIMNANNTTVLNEYEIPDLNSILVTHKVNLFLFLSIWPETFSFVIHEMMQTELPIISFNLGAQGAFLANYDNATLVDDVSFGGIYDALLLKYRNYETYVKSLGLIDFVRISVVIATYNGEKYIQEQLDSILAQTVPAHEIIVVDDCSTDNTWLILNDYATRYAQIKIYQNSENYGVANTFDYALSLARGEYIALADQDDFWVPQKLEVLIKQIGDNLLIHSDAYVVNDKLQIISSSFLGTKAFTKKISNYFVFNDVHGCTALIRRELLDLALPIPAGFYLHDHYLAIFAAALKKITYVDQPLIFYRQHEANVVGINKIDDYQEYQTHFKVLLDSLQLLTHPCFKESSELEYGVDFYHSNLLNKPAKFKTYWWYVRNFSISRSIFFIGRTCFGTKIGRLMFKLRNRIQ